MSKVRLSPSYEEQYLQFAQSLLFLGDRSDNRTGVSTRSIFGHQIKVDLMNEFPLLKTKLVRTDAIIKELLWFISGSTNVNDLKNQGVNIWNEWATEDGSLGPIYGHQWRNWEGAIDQLQKVIDNLKECPTSRRHIVTAWNPADLPKEWLNPQENVNRGFMALAPCHCLVQFNAAPLTLTYRRFLFKHGMETLNPDVAVEKAPSEEQLDRLNIPKYYIDCHMYQRSADWFLGVPFNTPSYALLTHIIGKLTNMVPRNLIHSFGDAHLYDNHESQMHEQLSRANRTNKNEFPSLIIQGNQEKLEDFKFEDFKIINYNPEPAIPAPIAV